MLEQVFHFCREIEADMGEGGIEGSGYFAGVAGTIEKIRVTESYMLGAVFDLLGDVGDDGFDGYDEKAAIVNWHDRTVAAGVQTAAAGLSIAGRVGYRIFDPFTVAC